MYINPMHLTYLLYVLSAATLIFGLAGTIFGNVGAIMISWVCFGGALITHKIAKKLRDSRPPDSLSKKARGKNRKD